MAEHDGVRAISDARRVAGDADPELIDSEYWARLTHAQDAASFTASWLDAQCRALGGVIRGAVVLRTSEAATFAPVAFWPEGVEGSPKLATVVEKALAEKRVAIQGAKHGGPLLRQRLFHHRGEL